MWPIRTYLRSIVYAKNQGDHKMILFEDDITINGENRKAYQIFYY